ncbi:hypothetical protein Q4512_15360 [Oceanihabitans sp. 2_MG-2023]|nr:hypothetical protein [Oceanihabitans sp. 2_MG-2023]MDO6598301.1 hypothetical protein [Oceanihabitans sp. 2_MG-2023]
MLDKDIMQVAVQEIPKIKVQQTFIGGVAQ